MVCHQRASSVTFEDKGQHGGKEDPCSKDTIGVGVVGTGFGVRVQLPVWQRTPGARVVAVYSHDEKRARQVAERFSLPYATTYPRELAALPEVDLVSIVTTPHLHYDGVMAALTEGKHVLCEKPFALSAAQAKEMLGSVDIVSVTRCGC
ncbi:MAG: Gfo/Idh/MocA family oxidoreductase [Chloroflexi bacterium]|nr:Gfo/Idh/MocA family oxidoreductase [Chloroflexota bacterium]